jgi:hypothetical protein
MYLLAGATPAAAHPAEQVGRPSLPDEQTFGTEHFLIHYTLTGRSAVEETDDDESGVPDFVELMAETLEYTWTVEVETMGWPQPPFDRGQGGDERIDVYLDNILRNGYAGYVETSGGYITDNPNTPEQERRAAYSYMVMDNDYSEADPDYNETPVGLMQATVAHEFNHVVQAGIDDLDLHAWLYEATATWMEDQVYPDVNDGLFYLDSVFKNPDICMVAENARGDDLHWYGNWLFIRLISERYGPETVLNIWNGMRQSNGFRAMDEALIPLGTTLEAENRDFAIANLLRAYEEGDLYPTVTVEGAVGTGTYTPRDGVQSLAADYARLDTPGPVSITLQTDEPAISLTAIGIRGAEADVIEAQANILAIDRDAYDEVYLVIHNATRIPDEHECWSVGYTLGVQAANPGNTSPVAEVWPTTFYVSPEEAPVSVSTEGNPVLPPGAPFQEDKTTSTTPEDLEVGFPVLLPGSLPPGYGFDYAYVMTAEDFGGSDIYYVPGGGETANFDYLDESNNWLSIAESPSPYVTIQEWMDDIAYTDTPGQIRQIAGVDVLVEDLSEPDDPWFSVTFIVDDLFIVVDGDTDEASVIKLAEGLIASSSSGGSVPAAEETAPAAPATPVPAVQPTPPAAVPTPATGFLSDQQSGLLAMVLGTLGVGSCIALACLAVLLPVGVVVIMGRRRRNRDIYVQRTDWY